MDQKDLQHRSVTRRAQRRQRVDRCPLINPDDELGAQGPGPRRLLGSLTRPRTTPVVPATPLEPK